MLDGIFKTFGNLLHKTAIEPDAIPQTRSVTAEASNTPAINGTMMQYFHWYVPADGNHWNRLIADAKTLGDAGFTALWLPPAYKGTGGGYDVGYGVYDLFDLGEFDQKKTIKTKYGSKDEYVAAIKAAQSAGMQIYADVVFNHKDGGDETEIVRATPYNRDDRLAPSGPPQDIEIYTKFNFAGRGNTYSSMKWNHWQFDSVNHNMRHHVDGTVYLFEGQSFEKFTGLEKGNYDFLMGCDLDMDNQQVQGELKYWGEWLLNTTGVDGFRLDALKHIPTWFYNVWLDHLRNYTKRNLFCVGEYWTTQLDTLKWYLDATGGRMSLFDVPLQNNFRTASLQGRSYDLRKILDGTLIQDVPSLAVTIVENHDTQPLQALENVVEPWFKPLAYALILLRREGYPCVFYADYYGAEYTDKGRDGKDYHITLPAHGWMINKFLHARKHYAYGDQYTYFNHPNTIGWTRLGDKDHPKAMAVLLSNGDNGSKWMEVGKRNAVFVDLTEHIKEPVKTNNDGWGEFHCLGGKVSVWIEQD